MANLPINRVALALQIDCCRESQQQKPDYIKTITNLKDTTKLGDIGLVLLAVDIRKGIRVHHPSIIISNSSFRHFLSQFMKKSIINLNPLKQNRQPPKAKY